MSALSHWWRRAPREERRLAAAAAGVALVLVGWALVPTGHEATGSLATTLRRHDAAGGVVSDAQTGAGPDASTSGQLGVGPANAVKGSAAPGAPHVGTGSAGAGAGIRTGCGSLRAGDQGVTPTDILVGVAVLDVNDPTINQQLGFRADSADIVRALVDDVNSRGGVACRRLAYRLYKVDPLDPTAQESTCIKAARDDKVFAFLDIGVLTSESTQTCVTRTYGVPLVDDTDWPASYVRDQAPYFLSPNTDANRAARTWVEGAKRDGFFDPARGFRKLGLLDCRNDGGIADEVKSDLAAVGVPLSSVVEDTLDCAQGLVAPSNQVAQAALHDKLAGVTHVFPATLSLNIETYLQAARSQDFKPRYGASDLYDLSAPGFTEDFDPSQWAGTIAYTATRSGELHNDHPSSETIRCDAALRAGHVAGIRTEWDDTARVYCDLFHFVTAALNHGSDNPTRLSFSQAAQTMGTLPFSGLSDGVFDRPGTYTGADFVRTIQWRTDADCGNGDPRGSSHQSNGCWAVLDPVFRRAI